MIVTREYCDRCGNEIVQDNPLFTKLFHIYCMEPRAHIRFTKKEKFVEQTKTVCLECMKQYWEWWKDVKK